MKMNRGNCYSEFSEDPADGLDGYDQHRAAYNAVSKALRKSGLCPKCGSHISQEYNPNEGYPSDGLEYFFCETCGFCVGHPILL